MITFSLLNNIEELKSVKIRQLSINVLKDLHPDHNWVVSEYTKWAKMFPDYNQRFVDVLTYWVRSAHIRCPSKERFLSVMKAFDNFAEIEAYLPAIREERSSEKINDFIKKIIKVLK